jgi:aldose sugar dehydrogenase
MFLRRYASVGSVALDRPESEHDNTWSQNVIRGAGVELRFTQDGKPVEDKFILRSENPVNLYCAYGTRNSLGMGFDRVSGFLWDTENGATGKDLIIDFVKTWF